MELDELQDVEAATIVDARGSACPGPLLEAKKGMGTVAVGESWRSARPTPGSRNDIPSGPTRWVTSSLAAAGGGGLRPHLRAPRQVTTGCQAR